MSKNNASFLNLNKEIFVNADKKRFVNETFETLIRQKTSRVY